MKPRPEGTIVIFAGRLLSRIPTVSFSSGSLQKTYSAGLEIAYLFLLDAPPLALIA